MDYAERVETSQTLDQLQDPSLVVCLAVHSVDDGLAGDILLKGDIGVGAPAEQMRNMGRLGLPGQLPPWHFR